MCNNEMKLCKCEINGMSQAKENLQAVMANGYREILKCGYNGVLPYAWLKANASLASANGSWLAKASTAGVMAAGAAGQLAWRS